MILASVCAGDEDCGFLSSLEFASRSADAADGGRSGSSEGGCEAALGHSSGGGEGSSGSSSESEEGSSLSGWGGVVGGDSEDPAADWQQRQQQGEGPGEATVAGSSSNGSSPGRRGRQAPAVQELALDLDSWQQVGEGLGRGAPIKRCMCWSVWIAVGSHPPACPCPSCPSCPAPHPSSQPPPLSCPPADWLPERRACGGCGLQEWREAGTPD